MCFCACRQDVEHASRLALERLSSPAARVAQAVALLTQAQAQAAPVNVTRHKHAKYIIIMAVANCMYVTWLVDVAHTLARRPKLHQSPIVQERVAVCQGICVLQITSENSTPPSSTTHAAAAADGLAASGGKADLPMTFVAGCAARMFVSAACQLLTMQHGKQL